MTLDIFKEKGTPLDLMNGLESDAVRFSHATARMMNGEMRLPLAKVRRVEQHQQTMVNCQRRTARA